MLCCPEREALWKQDQSWCGAGKGREGGRRNPCPDCRREQAGIAFLWKVVRAPGGQAKVGGEEHTYPPLSPLLPNLGLFYKGANPIHEGSALIL